MSVDWIDSRERVPATVEEVWCCRREDSEEVYEGVYVGGMWVINGIRMADVTHWVEKRSPDPPPLPLRTIVRFVAHIVEAHGTFLHLGDSGPKVCMDLTLKLDLQSYGIYESQLSKFVAGMPVDVLLKEIAEYRDLSDPLE